jgi:hypothetical protein
MGSRKFVMNVMLECATNNCLESHTMLYHRKDEVSFDYEYCSVYCSIIETRFQDQILSLTKKIPYTFHKQFDI